jgi:hypothetical protein
MTNYSCFERNCIDAFGSFDVSTERLNEAEALFLKHGGGPSAEKDALTFLRLHERSDPMVDMAAKVWSDARGEHRFTDASSKSLKAFMRDTAYRGVHGNRTKTPWPHWSTV